MNYKGAADFDVVKIYNFFSRFMYTFLPNFFLDKEFQSL